MSDLINYLTIGVLSLLGTGVLIGVIVLVIRNAESLKSRDYSGVTSTFKKVFTTATYFRAAILVCMIVSIGHGSHLFATKNNTEWLQFALAATIDVGIWVLIEALIALRKRGYLVASVSVLCGIVVLSVVSYAANFVYNQHFYDATQFTYVPSWFLLYVPFIQSCPPLIIAFMSTVAEVFVKPENDTDISEDKSFKDRIKALYTRKNDRLEAKLEARKQRHDIRKKYSVSGNLTRQVKWSFLWILRGYYEPTQAVDQEAAQKIKDQGEKITELVTRLEELSAVTTQQHDQLHQKDSVIVSHETTINTLTSELAKLVTSVETLQQKLDKYQEDHSVSGNLTHQEYPHTEPIVPVTPMSLEPVTVTSVPASNGHSVSTGTTRDLPVYRPKKR